MNPRIYRDPADKGRLPLLRVEPPWLRWVLVAGFTLAVLALLGLLAELM